jgi:hypothetical protein
LIPQSMIESSVTELSLACVITRDGGRGGGVVVSHVVPSRSVLNSGIRMGYHERSKPLTSRFTNFETLRTAVGLSLVIHIHRPSRLYGDTERRQDRCKADATV